MSEYRGRNQLLNFPFPSSLCCQSSVSLHPGKLAGAPPYIFPSKLHAVLSFGFSWNGSSVVELLFLCRLRRTVNPLQPGFCVQNMIRLKLTANASVGFYTRHIKPEICPQPPTALFYLHGKLFWSGSNVICFLCTEDKSLLNHLNLSLRMTPKKNSSSEGLSVIWQ